MAASESNPNHDGARPAGRLRRLAVLAVTIAGLVATMLIGAQGASAASAAKPARVPAHTYSEMQMIGAVGHLINVERAAHGLAPIHQNSDLVLSARRHNLEMAAYNTMSHQLPGEAYFASRMSAAGYRWTWAGENIAWNTNISVAGVTQLEQLMYNEKAPNDGHRLNILNSHFQDVGVDVYVDSAHHKVWLTTDFGRH